MTKRIRTSRIVDQITTATDKRFELVAHMADAILEMTLKFGDCVQQDLLANGLAQQDVITFWHFAKALAVIEIRCRKNGVGSSFTKEVRYA